MHTIGADRSPLTPMVREEIGEEINATVVGTMLGQSVGTTATGTSAKCTSAMATVVAINVATTFRIGINVRFAAAVAVATTDGRLRPVGFSCGRLPAKQRIVTVGLRRVKSPEVLRQHITIVVEAELAIQC